MEKKCVWCESCFEAKYSGKIYCSQSCRQYAYLNRNGMNINDRNLVNNNNPINAVNEEFWKPAIGTSHYNHKWINSKMIGLIEANLEKRWATLWLREYQEKLCQSDSDFTDWVNERLKCLLHNLINLTYKPKININTVQALLGAFEETVSSFEYENLPDGFPFRKEVNDLKEKLETLTKEPSYKDEFKFCLSIERKAEIIWMLYSIGKTVLLKKFKELFER